jgi:hypothetical protein
MKAIIDTASVATVIPSYIYQNMLNFNVDVNKNCKNTNILPTVSFKFDNKFYPLELEYYVIQAKGIFGGNRCYNSFEGVNVSGFD